MMRRPQWKVTKWVGGRQGGVVVAVANPLVAVVSTKGENVEVLIK